MIVADIVDGIRRQRQPILSRLSLRGVLHHQADAMHYIIHISKIPPAVAIVEYLYLLTCQQLVGKPEICHIRPTGRAIHRKEPQPCRGDIVQLAVGMSQQLIAFLGSGIQGHGIVHLVLSRIWHLFIGAVHRRRGSIHQMLHPLCPIIIGMAAGLKDIVKADDIRLHVGVRIGNGIPDTCLGRQIDHYSRRIC